MPISYIRREDVESLRHENLLIPEDVIPAQNVQYANGDIISSTSRISIGQCTALVMPDQVDSLICPNFALDAGATMTLNTYGGEITNSSNSSTIPIHRIDGQFRCDLRDIFNYNHGTSTTSGIAASVSTKTPLEHREMSLRKELFSRQQK